ncbi:hypothetical protein PV708_30660 [Streptomyces sp. ME02-6977A]|uniref:hypothetical protein n=1 Tax=Streptomyces sp. ME02-6977A TaxID=3028671 RepID=UPI0029A98115|nr:hypothetical protein [Streptomyces sp. ME02-6977A]MDX3410541.1 hypothetical protein [Streptomyces sp. ME02-6977A]
MDATTLLSLLAARETATAKDAASSRDRLAAALAAGGGLHLDHLMDEVLKAEGKAAPWRQLMNVIEDRGVSQGLAKMRQKATEHLVVYGIAMSTSLVTNAARLAELDGLRAFLSATSGMEVDEEATPEAEAPVEEAEEPAAGAVGKRAARRLPRLWPEGGWNNPLLLLAAALLTVGAVLGSLIPLGLGWLIAYLSRRLTPAQSKWAVLGLPGTVAAAGVVWLWGRTEGRWGDPVAEGHMNDAIAETWPWVLRTAAVATALYLLWRSRRPHG